jgi:UDP-glucose 4-epimerase
VIDDLSAGDAGRLHSSVAFTRGDVNDIPLLWKLLGGVQCVYHVAARISVTESTLYPRDYNAVNVGGTVSVLEAVRDAGVQRIVLASSGAIYGDLPTMPLREEVQPNPSSPYAVSKLAAEYYVRTTGILWGMTTVSLRLFNVYGPGQQLPKAHPPVIPSFMRQALKGGSIVVHGDGKQTRDFVYIDDVVDALVRAATAENIDREVINVGSGVETSVNELIRKISVVISKDLSPLYVPTAERGSSRICADLTKARALLDYVPKVMLDEGLQRTFGQDERFRH